jgi:diadenosine tetraphosphate (Ap4A) HIT family hydrolase
LKPEEGQLIWRGDDCRIILVSDPELPGFCRVIWNQHAVEMTDLTYGEREHLMTLVFAVEEAVRHVMQPDKMNVAALGNMVPHIHWHVIPRYQDDAFFPGSVWSNKINTAPASVLEARMQKVKDLPAVIREAISRLK